MINLTQQKAKYKRYLDGNVWTPSIITVERHIYVDRSRVILMEENEKTSLRYNELLSSVTRRFIIMEVNSHVITMIKIAIQNNISIDYTTSIVTKIHVTKKRKRKLRQLAQTTVPTYKVRQQIAFGICSW